MIRNFRILPGLSKNIALVHSRRIPCISSFSTTQRVSSSQQNINDKNGGDQNNDEQHRRKMGNYYSMLIASSVGIIGSSYLLFQRFSKVEAKELLEGDESLVLDDENVEKSQKKISSELTLHKSQAGFRERKVNTKSVSFFRYLVYSGMFYSKNVFYKFILSVR